MAQTSIEWFIEQIKEYDCTPPSNNEQYVIVMPSWIFDAKKKKPKKWKGKSMGKHGMQHLISMKLGQVTT